MATYTQQDFKSDQIVKWCPGCGDHAVLAAVLKAMPEICEKKNLTRDQFVFVSGIGCSSRFPYYMNTYGFHGIHGRAGALATGVKVANPDLSVWQMTGDGDALAIGGNHFIHEIRRNVDVNIILFNNKIYGLTKGQYSPTSKYGMVTKTSPYGTVEHPFTPGELVLGARGTFFARSLDVEMALNQEIIVRAALHNGCSVMEMLVNCMIFNNGAHAEISDREVRAERTIVLKDGEPMIFGKERDKGIILDGLKLKVVKLGENGITEKDLLVHNSKADDFGIQSMLVDMKGPDFPVALGVIRDIDEKSYDQNVAEQVESVKANSKIHSMDQLLTSGATWSVE